MKTKVCDLGSMNRAILAVFAVAIAACEGEFRSPQPAPEDALASRIAGLSVEYRSAIGDAIGAARKARFVDGGRRVLVLDQFPPYLRLFTSEGRALWQGVREGEGPLEFSNPQALAADGRQGVAAQMSKLLHWSLENDTLAVRETLLPARLVPYDATYGCDGSPLLHGLDRREFFVSDPDSVWGRDSLPWLHRIRAEEESAVLDPLWSRPRDLTAARMGSRGALLSRLGDRFVLFYRPARGPGLILELDCEFRVRASIREERMVTGDSIPAIEPRSRALEWSNGSLPTPDGFIVAVGRYASERGRESGTTELPMGWHTELFRFSNGQFVGSALIREQWFLMDYDREAGALMASDTPIPHFIVVPPSVILFGPSAP